MTREDASYFTYRTPHGPITIGAGHGLITDIRLGQVSLKGQQRPTELSNACATELLEYFAGKRMAFSVPVGPEGTPFQMQVWKALCAIPYGQVRTNSEIAEVLGRPSSFRMVGAAARKNPVAIIVPSHRIVGASGKPSGADRDAQIRTALIELESRYSQDAPTH